MTFVCTEVLVRACEDNQNGPQEHSYWENRITEKQYVS
jgi:hypothetical protein